MKIYAGLTATIFAVTALLMFNYLRVYYPGEAGLDPTFVSMACLFAGLSAWGFVLLLRPSRKT